MNNGSGDGDFRRTGRTETEENNENPTRPQEVNWHKIIWENHFPIAFSMGISITEFKHMNPKMLEMCMKGYEQRRRLEDEQWFLRFREYGIISAALGVRLGMNKGKVEYPETPILYEEDEATKEERLQKQREAFLGGLLAMQANFELNHPKKESE